MKTSYTVCRRFLHFGKCGKIFSKVVHQSPLFDIHPHFNRVFLFTENIFNTLCEALACVCVCVFIPGPVLDESLFFPETTKLDNTTIFINWGLSRNSRPAQLFLLTVGSTRIPVLVTDPTHPPTRQQHSPVVQGELLHLGIRALDSEDNSSPEMSVMWRVGDGLGEERLSQSLISQEVKIVLTEFLQWSLG